jgi:hypothetical protein
LRVAGERCIVGRTTHKENDMALTVRLSQTDGLLIFTIEDGLTDLANLSGAPNPLQSVFSIRENDASAGALDPRTSEAAVNQLGGINYRQRKWTVVDEQGLGIWEHNPA